MKKLALAAAVLLQLVCSGVNAEGTPESLMHDLLTLKGSNSVEADLEFMRKSGRTSSLLPGELEAYAMAFSFKPESLAAMADKARESGVVLESGELAVTAFYEEVQKYTLAGEGVQEQFDKAAEENPASKSIRLLALSVALTNAAEPSRVPLLVSVREDPIAPDPATIAKLRSDLLAVKSIAASEPYWFNLMAEVLIIQKASEEDVRAVVKEGLEAFPQNTRLAVLGSNRFLPRWGGDASRLERYARFVSELPAMRDRKDIYARIYWNALKLQYRLTLFKVAGKEWGLMEPSLESLVKSYPTLEHLNAAALMACLGGDRAMTRAILRNKKFTPAQRFWQDKDAMELCYGWAS